MDPLEEGRFLTPDEVSIYFSWLQNLPNLIKPLMRMPATWPPLTFLDYYTESFESSETSSDDKDNFGKTIIGQRSQPMVSSFVFIALFFMLNKHPSQIRLRCILI